MSALHSVHDSAKVVLLDLRAVPVIDATGLVNLESAIARLHQDGLAVVLAGVRSQPRAALLQAGLVDRPGALWVCEDVEEGLERARAQAAAVA